MTRLYNGQEDWEQNIVQTMTDQAMASIEKKNEQGLMTVVEEARAIRSPYHNIRHTTHGSTAPFINMPLGQTRVYVERIR